MSIGVSINRSICITTCTVEMECNLNIFINHYCRFSSRSDKIHSCWEVCTHCCKDFEDQFRKLHKEILCQIVDSGIDTNTVIHSLTLLPMRLRNEYQKLVEGYLPPFYEANKRSINDLFFHLNPLFIFLDYRLLQHIIKLFDNNALKEDMSTYCDDLQIFVKQTTV